jgi:hypothetical protein
MDDSPVASAPEFPASDVFQDRSRWIWKALLGFVVCGVLITVTARPAYRYVKARRALSLVESARVAMAAGRWDEVARAVTATLGLAPQHPEVLRLAAQFCSHHGAAQGLDYWQALLATRGATGNDRRQFARLAQDLGRLDLSGGAIQELLASEPADRTHRLLLLDQFVLLGNWQGAIDGAQLMLKDEPSDPYLRFVLAKALLGTREPNAGAQAAGILRELKQPGNPQYLAALHTLASLQGLPRDEVRGLISELEARPRPTLGERLLVADLRTLLEPDRAADIARETAGALPPTATPTEFSSMAGFLRSRGLSDEILKMLPMRAIRTNATLFMVAVDALADGGRWLEIQQFASDPKAPIDPVARACSLAVAARGLGRAVEAAAMLNEAIHVTKRSLSHLGFVADVAEKLGFPEVALEAWSVAVEDPRASIQAANQLLRLGRARDDIEAERRAYRRLKTLLGGEPVVRGELAYLDILAGQGVDLARDTLIDMVREMPSAPSPRAALALAQLKSGQTSAALGTLEGGSVNWENQEPRWQTIYAAALDANQQRAAARRVAAKIDRSRLKAAELQLLQSLAARG